MRTRDVGAVFKILNEAGYSQRHLAALTRQAQSEISEILAGRDVTSVIVLERIADGLGTPRGWWRLAGYDSVADEIQRSQARLAAQAVAARELDRKRRVALTALSSPGRTGPRPHSGRNGTR